MLHRTFASWSIRSNKPISFAMNLRARIIVDLRLLILADPSPILKKQVKADLTGTMNALEVIKKYGTHYMETAKLSGLRICSAALDVRNTIDITKLRTAMKTKVLSLFLDVCSHDRI